MEGHHLSTPIADRLTEHRQKAPEAKHLHGGQKSHEHIGHMLITAEAVKRGGEVHSETKVQLPPDKRIDTLPRSELLNMSEHITVEGSSLRQIYETHLISEQALRRLVAEYLHGGDLQKALQREIVEHEIDFERDPALRGMVAPTEAAAQEAAPITIPGKEALDQLLQKAAAGIMSGDEDLLYDQTHPEHKLKQPAHTHSMQRWRPIDIFMAVTILILLVLVIMLYFWHR